MHAAALRAADLLLPSTPVIVLSESPLQRSHKHGQMLAPPFRAPHVRSTAAAVSSPDWPAGRRAAAVLPRGTCLKNGACMKASSGRARSREQQNGVCWSWVSVGAGYPAAPGAVLNPGCTGQPPWVMLGCSTASSCCHLYSVRFGRAASTALFLAGCSSVAAGST